MHLSYEEWKNRPVYVAQCTTFAVARGLLGIKTLGQGKGYVSILGAPDALYNFRALPGYRTPEGQKLRDEVAATMRVLRNKTRKGVDIAL